MFSVHDCVDAGSNPSTTAISVSSDIYMYEVDNHYATTYPIGNYRPYVSPVRTKTSRIRECCQRGLRQVKGTLYQYIATLPFMPPPGQQKRVSEASYPSMSCHTTTFGPSGPMDVTVLLPSTFFINAFRPWNFCTHQTGGPVASAANINSLQTSHILKTHQICPAVSETNQAPLQTIYKRLEHIYYRVFNAYKPPTLLPETPSSIRITLVIATPLMPFAALNIFFLPPSLGYSASLIYNSLENNTSAHSHSGYANIGILAGNQWRKFGVDAAEAMVNNRVVNAFATIAKAFLESGLEYRRGEVEIWRDPGHDCGIAIGNLVARIQNRGKITVNKLYTVKLIINRQLEQPLNPKYALLSLKRTSQHSKPLTERYNFIQRRRVTPKSPPKVPPWRYYPDFEAADGIIKSHKCLVGEHDFVTART
ncbi:uncharacterized protein BDR25DRAFT_357604 [Lindgomyces ingoldianus]|uniref:Uncharacterized protein n=1 Tax=Lindgomyces ingoldianus TaxID=673940 RepID=A0ACB6QP09_9PLEO|nr:uncharacterized protein BDR25DRAFT_357604 [Lindgomyces ingoldianus]KAF2468308.1 hypothetical protein BDR25DRAFT_357604 [Lindgomyces ingoldianus]